MKALAFIYSLYNIVSDKAVHVTVVMWGLTLTDMFNMGIKLMGVLPGAVYVCIKIYKELSTKKK